MIVEQDHPVLGRVELPNLPFRFSESGCVTAERCAAALRLHNRKIASKLGYSTAEIDAMRRDDVLYAEEAVDRLRSLTQAPLQFQTPLQGRRPMAAIAIPSSATRSGTPSAAHSCNVASQTGQDMAYEATEATPGRFKDGVDAFRKAGGREININSTVRAGRVRVRNASQWKGKQQVPRML